MPNANQLSVLLIEDNDEHATIIARHLRQVEDARVVVSRVSCLAEGLRQLATNQFDALLLDLQLPDSQMEETLHCTLEHAIDVPIIVISTIEERALAKKALKEGAQAYLCKADLSSELLYRAIDYAIERQVTDARLRAEVRRKQVLFDLSQQALYEKDVACLFDMVMMTLSRALQVEFIAIMEFLPEEHVFLLRAGVGWKDHLVGQEKAGAELNSLAGFTLRASRPTIPGNLSTLEPVIIDDLTMETRFSPAPFMRDHGIISGVSVVIHGRDQAHPYGILGVHSAIRRAFTVEEAQFLQSAANVLAAALLRAQLEVDLINLNTDLERRVATRTRDLEQSQTLLRGLATKLNLAEQQERKRVATELHDHLAQMLVLGRLKLGQAKRRLSMDSECQGLLAEADKALSDSLSYARTLVANLSPSVLYEFGLPTAIKWLADQMQRYDLTVALELPDEPPMTLPEDQAVLIFQSVRELLMNSAKHSKSSQATVILQYQQEALRVEVRDQGIGFDVAALTHGGPSPKFGLFSIRERMTALGGLFTIQSQDGQGTFAVLTLPMSRETIVRPSPLNQARKDIGLSVAEPPRLDTQVQVLLVDDHAMIRQGLRSVLETYSDIRVVGEACDGVEAIAQADRLCPSIVVMDINMPKMNGIDATARIKTRHPGMVVIGLSVNASSENEQAMREAGAALLLTKEAAVEQLHSCIQEAMQESRP